MVMRLRDPTLDPPTPAPLPLPPPPAEELELLSLAEKNKELILQTLAPIAIEQAPALLPILSSVLRTPPTVFYGIAAAALAAEAGVALTFDSVPLDVIAGIPLLTLAAASAIGGSILSSGIKIPASAPAPKKAAASPAKAASAPKAAAAPATSRPKISAVKVAAPKPVAAAPAPKPAPKVREWLCLSGHQEDGSNRGLRSGGGC